MVDNVNIDINDQAETLFKLGNGSMKILKWDEELFDKFKDRKH